MTERAETELDDLTSFANLSALDTGEEVTLVTVILQFQSLIAWQNCMHSEVSDILGTALSGHLRETPVF